MPPYRLDTPRSCLTPIFEWRSYMIHPKWVLNSSSRHTITLCLTCLQVPGPLAAPREQLLRVHPRRPARRALGPRRGHRGPGGRVARCSATAHGALLLRGGERLLLGGGRGFGVAEWSSKSVEYGRNVMKMDENGLEMGRTWA